MARAVIARITIAPVLIASITIARAVIACSAVARGGGASAFVDAIQPSSYKGGPIVGWEADAKLGTATMARADTEATAD